MKLLVIGNGGREHAMVWKLAQSEQVEKIFVAPGNAGTAEEHKAENVSIAATDLDGLLDFAKTQSIDLTVVGPEAPLAAGIVDTFASHHLRCFGPNQKAAQLEASKAFSKDFFAKYHIPTARYRVFTDFDTAWNYAQTESYPLVIKADGLAAGKGVVIAQNPTDAKATLQDMFTGQRFGQAGEKIVIEEFLTGEEASIIVLTDGQHIIPFPTSQDHKARDNGDLGPNTGGMGAYSPAAVVTPAIETKIMQQVIEPTLAGLKAENINYCGFLYAGLMINRDGSIKVLEFNCRLGDPETQPLLMRLQSDLLPALNAAIDGNLDTINLTWDPRPALTVVMCADGYPDSYAKGQTISNIPAASLTSKTFHAGTIIEDNQVKTNGGRVLGVTVCAENIHSAQSLAYQVVEQIDWNDSYYRTDIGYKEIAREKEQN